MKDSFANADKAPSCWLVGAGGFGREVASWAQNATSGPTDAARLAFIDDDPDLVGQNRLGVPIDGTIADLTTASGGSFAITIGTSVLRRQIADTLTEAAVSPVCLLHPSVAPDPTVDIGAGTILCARVTPTVNVRIGCHVIVNLHATIGHDAVLGDFVTLHPGVHVSGHVVIGEATEIGTGAVLLPGVTVGANVRVGAGAVVTSDVPDGETVVGVPARATMH
ncbi:transferase [Longibacter salinarum]|uniref:Transferase n=1 Tax=Longibacter salinarum TaxID=1850348 RepID=A0A2A8D0T7_9BACT|nr:acetyltransferase [Longibacter salinarum]PEN14504.1 transferase [Longibacter salinarum]